MIYLNFGIFIGIPTMLIIYMIVLRVKSKKTVKN